MQLNLIGKVIKPRWAEPELVEIPPSQTVEISWGIGKKATEADENPLGVEVVTAGQYGVQTVSVTDPETGLTELVQTRRMEG